jgi:hypothetical protein
VRAVRATSLRASPARPARSAGVRAPLTVLAPLPLVATVEHVGDIARRLGSIAGAAYSPPLSSKCRLVLVREFVVNPLADSATRTCDARAKRTAAG